MTQRALELLQKVLALTEEERAELAGSLIESLDGRADADAECKSELPLASRMASTKIEFHEQASSFKLHSSGISCAMN